MKLGSYRGMSIEGQVYRDGGVGSLKLHVCAWGRGRVDFYRMNVTIKGCGLRD